MTDTPFDNYANKNAPEPTDRVSIIDTTDELWRTPELQYLAKGMTRVNEQTGAAYTLALSDHAAFVYGNRATAQTFTIPPNSSVAFPVNTVITVLQFGVGTVTVEAFDSGVVLNGIPSGSADISAQYAAVGLWQQATDVWVIFGAHEVVA